MKYKTPELTALTPAINAIQSPKTMPPAAYDALQPTAFNESIGGYADWEY